MSYTYKNYESNLHKEVLKLEKFLNINKDVIICKAYKSNITVVLNKQDYKTDQRNFY